MCIAHLCLACCVCFLYGIITTGDNMYKKLRGIENIALICLLVNITLMILLYVGLSVSIFSILMILSNVSGVYAIFKKIGTLKKSISDSRILLPALVNQAIEMDQYCILMFDKSTMQILWQNEHFTESFGSLLEQDVTKIFDGFLFDDDTDEEHLFYNDNYYSVVVSEETIILKNVTLFVQTQKDYENEKDCILFIKVDSIDDISASLDEVSYQNIMQKIRQTISDYTKLFDSILRRYKNDSYIVVVKQKDFKEMIKEGIDVLEKVKEVTRESDDKITLSIGGALGFNKLSDTEFQAGKALDMALARGGDQIVVKEKDKDYKFYGGNSEVVEKRNRVKVRMIASSLETLIKEASNVVLMPHANPDLDAIGACFGMVKFVHLNNKDVVICSNPDMFENNTRDAYYLLGLDERNLIKTSDQVKGMINKDTLLIVLDTSNIEIFESREIYELIEKRIVIDHHRRSNDFIKNPILVYVEPYASSTVELVTELLVFQSKSFRLNSDIATLMLAGMMVDTAYFTVRTGVRTFEAATLLKDNGASPLQAKEILQVSRDTYQKKLAMVSDAVYFDDNIAITKYTKEPVTRSLLAQAAVELLEVRDIVATFVLGYLEDGSVGISARSNGEFNVQSIIEELGGGGHFSMAAAQMNDDINNVEYKLEEILKKHKEGNEE